jgi:hypothetical protein
MALAPDTVAALDVLKILAAYARHSVAIALDLSDRSVVLVPVRRLRCCRSEA